MKTLSLAALALLVLPLARARAQCTFAPPGLAGDVYALAVFDGALYAGGDFDAAGGGSASRLARWNGSVWSAVGSDGLEGVEGGAQVLVGALAVFDDGAGSALWVGGAFESAGGHAAGSIARFDGARWTPLGLGAGFDDAVLALCVHDPDGEGEEPATLWAGGLFRRAGNERAAGLARWDPRAGTWRAALAQGASGVDGVVHALASVRGALVLGGRFTRAGEVAAANLARFDGTRFEPVGATRERPAGGTDGPVQALAVADTGAGPELYLGGSFARAGGVATGPIARLTSSGFAPLGAGLGPVGRARRAPRVFGLSALDAGGPGNGRQRLVVCGRYGSAGALAADALAGEPEPQPVDPDEGPSPGQSLRGGRRLLASWDGASWSALGVLGDDARAAAAFGGALHVGGRFESAGRGGASRIARRDEALGTLEPLSAGNGLGGGARALAVHDFGRAFGEPSSSGPALVAAGAFRAAGTELTPGLALWAGGGWHALGAGTDGPVNALLSFDGALVAGGAFTAAGARRAARIARFDGASWSTLGDGLGDEVLALAAFEGALIAGGEFLTAGGRPAAHVARWDGHGWSALGEGLDDAVRALAVFDAGDGPALYAGGEFEHSGESATRYVARWDGAHWQPLGLGVEKPVHALAVFDDGAVRSLVVGGEFTRAGSLQAQHVARWSGERWARLGPGDAGVDGAVYALAAQGAGAQASLWVGGDFARAGALASARVARWSGGSWHAGTPGGRGLDEAVLALAPFDERVFAAGAFTRLDAERASAHLVALGCPNEGEPTETDR